MSAAARSKRKRPPTFHHYVDVDVDIDPEDLEAEGWVYVGKGEKDAPVASTDRFVRLIRDMHDDEHVGPMRWCPHALCKEVEQP